MNLLFLDVATTTGIAQGEIGKIPILDTARFGMAGDDEIEIFGLAAIWMRERVRATRPSTIWIEAPMNPSSRHASRHSGASSRRLIGLYAVIAAIARECGVPCHSVDVKTVRKFCLGHGNMKAIEAKPEIARVVRALGCDPQNFDESDAAGGWFWAASLYPEGRKSLRSLWPGPQLSIAWAGQ